MPLRLVFMGSPAFALPSLAAILGAGHEIAAVYTQPPRPAGRGMEKRKSPVHAFAETAGLAVRAPASLKAPDEQAALTALGAHAIVVVAYGLLLPAAVLAAPRQGCLNLHPSKLPRWRGAAPIQRTVMAGDHETAVMVMRMDEGLDTGPVCMAETVAVGPEVTAGELHDTLARLGGDLMVRALGALERGTLDCRVQAGDGITYAAKIAKEEARIDWARNSARVHDHIRGLSPVPGACFEAAGERIKVLRSEVADGRGTPGEVLDDRLTIACGEGAGRLLMLQRQGKKTMPADELLRGFALPVGTRVG